MQWLALTYLISLGTMQYDLVIPNSEFLTPKNTVTTTLGIEALFAEHFFISGSVETWEQMDSTSIYFYPMESLYKINAGLRWNGLEIGFKHECDHPVVSNSILLKGFFTSQSSFYLSYTGKLNIF